jgi:hypothetical protein
VEECGFSTYFFKAERFMNIMFNAREVIIAKSYGRAHRWISVICSNISSIHLRHWYSRGFSGITHGVKDARIG